MARTDIDEAAAIPDRGHLHADVTPVQGASTPITHRSLLNSSNPTLLSTSTSKHLSTTLSASAPIRTRVRILLPRRASSAEEKGFSPVRRTCNRTPRDQTSAGRSAYAWPAKISGAA